MRNQKLLLLSQLDRKLVPFKELQQVSVPTNGWVNNIRKALNITLEQLGNKLGITKQGMRGIEQSEEAGSISINSLKQVANALDMQLVYGFAPLSNSIEDLVDKKAKALASKIVLRTNQNMKLENQGNSKEQIDKAISELATELKREMKKSIWD